VLRECGSGFDRPMRERYVCRMNKVGIETRKDFPGVRLTEFDEWHSQRFLSEAAHSPDEASVYFNKPVAADSSLNGPNLGRLRRNATLHCAGVQSKLPVRSAAGVEDPAVAT